ncbi:hypothetical protein [Paucibacter sp. M5-1]|uniref:hypothetical protein n=1 Tax=Paucibacter sp. M5-1 TaxID=3015998 RepID=UPI0022B8BF1B|nr:hypothetical protein [Paucibacter sp. M5-1]MCZ7884054.1 hypothetical protein [Paucibacter sp. M5-1]
MNKNVASTNYHALLAPLVLVALLAPAAPVQASELVKLARLVVTGKRLGPEPTAAERARIQQLPPVLIEGRRSTDGLQVAAQPRGLPKAL